MKKAAAGSSMLMACGIGLILSSILMILLVLISALCISNEYFSVGSIRYTAVVIQFVGALAGAITAGRIAAEKKAAACAITACGLVVFQLCSALLFFDGVSANVIPGAIAAGVAVVCAIYLCCKNKKPSGSKKKRNRYR